MSEGNIQKRQIVRFETVELGKESSWLSRIIFVILLAIPVVSCVLFGAVDHGTWILIATYSAAVLLLWMAEEWRFEGLLINTSSLQLPVIGLIAIGLVQMVPLGGQTISLDAYNTRLFTFRLLIYLVFLAASFTFINTEQRIKKASLLIVIFGSLMGFYGILQWLTGPDGIYGLRPTPSAIPFGPFVNQHHFAAFMQMTAGIAIALLFGRSTGRDKRLLLAIAVILMGTAAVLTSSRGGMIGFVAVVAFVLMVNIFSCTRVDGAAGTETDPRRKLILAVSGAALILVIFGVVLFVGGNDSLLRGVGLGAGQTDVSNGRAHFWPIALKIFFGHPILGAGFDAFAVAYTRFDSWNGVFRVEQAHNDYLQSLSDAGILGFGCVAAYIYLLFRKGFRTIAETAGGFRRNVAVGALAGCFGILIHSFFDFPLPHTVKRFFLSAFISDRDRPGKGCCSVSPPHALRGL